MAWKWSVNKDQLKDYGTGYTFGLRDGKHEKAGGDDIEQDFAYKSSDYERGYRDGFAEGRK